jgi:hypothetical protein
VRRRPAASGSVVRKDAARFAAALLGLVALLALAVGPAEAEPLANDALADAVATGVAAAREVA